MRGGGRRVIVGVVCNTAHVMLTVLLVISWRDTPIFSAFIHKRLDMLLQFSQNTITKPWNKCHNQITFYINESKQNFYIHPNYYHSLYRYIHHKSVDTIFKVIRKLLIIKRLFKTIKPYNFSVMLLWLSGRALV